MAPKNTDKFLKVAPNTGWALDASGIINGTVDNFGLINATGLPTDTAILITIDRVNANGAKTPAKMERILGIVDGNRMINCVRGVGGTAQAHAGGAVIEIVISAENFNKWVEALIAEHKQSGIHRGPKSAAYTPDPSDTVTLDLDVANKHKIQMPAGNITIAFENDEVDQIFMLEITQDAVGGRTVTWPDGITWVEGAEPALSGADKKDVLVITVDDAGEYTGSVVYQNL